MEKRFDEDLQQPFPNRYEKKGEVVARRNQYLLHFFNEIKQRVRLVGHPERPTIVLDDIYSFSAYVHNFYIIFTDAIYNGNIIARYKLFGENTITQEEFDSLLNKMEVNRLFRLQYKETGLFLAGYNFRNRIDKAGKYPVFSKYDYKLYFTESRANEIINEFKNYPLVLA